MKRFFAIPFLVFAVIVSAPTAPPAPLMAARTRLTLGDVDRMTTVVWSRDGGLAVSPTWGVPPTYTLIDSAGNKTTLPRAVLPFWEDQSDQAYYGGVTIPQALSPGQYMLDAGRGPELAITVLPAVARKPVTIPAGTSAAKIQQLVGIYNDLTFAPGRYDLDRLIRLPANCRLWGHHAVIHPLVGSLGVNNAVFEVDYEGVSLYGFEFVYDQPGQAIAGLNQPGMVLKDCTFRRCNLGFYMVDALVSDCDFHSAGAVQAPTGLWLRNTFHGPATQQAWSGWSGLGRYAMVDNVFEGCDRGPCFNTVGGPITDGLWISTRLRNIDTVGGGNEMFAFEGPGPFSRHLFLHTRCTGCTGAIFQWGGNADGTAQNNLVNDLEADGIGILFWGANVTNNTVSNFRLHGGAGIYCGPADPAKPTGVQANNAFVDGSVNGWYPNRGSASFQNPSPVMLGRTVAAWAGGASAATNTLQRVSVATAPGSFATVAGFTTLTSAPAKR